MTPRADTDELSSRFGGPEILRVEALSKRFVRARVRGLRQERTQLNAVAGVTLSIAPGKTLGLVGESGCGKSTLARLVVRLLEPTSGRIILDGRDITRVSGRELRRVRRRMQIVFQDPLSALNPRQTVGQIVGAPLSIHRVRGDRRARVRELLARVGLSPEHYNRYPHEFSGGQRQRISIARALALDPDLLVLDEPVSSLDVSVQAQILNLLHDLQDDLGLTYLFISHDLAVVREMADRLAVMYLGRIVEDGPAGDVFAEPGHPYTAALLSAVPRVRGSREPRQALAGDVPSPEQPPGGCAFHPRCPKARVVAGPTGEVPERCSGERPALQERGTSHGVACWFPLALAGAPPPVAEGGNGQTIAAASYRGHEQPRPMRVDGS